MRRSLLGASLVAILALIVALGGERPVRALAEAGGTCTIVTPVPTPLARNEPIAPSCVYTGGLRSLSVISNGGTVTASLPYSGTSDGQTLTANSALLTGFVDSAGTFTRWKSAKAFDSAASDSIAATQICDLNTLVCGHLTANRELLVQPSNGGHAQTISAAGNASDNVTQFGGNNVVTGVGASGVGIPRVTVANDSAVNQTTSIPGYTRIQDGSSTSLGAITGVGNQDRNSSGFNAFQVGSYTLAYAGSNNWDRMYKDTYAAGPIWTTPGGALTGTIAAATAGPSVIKGGAGRLAKVLITTAGTTGTETLYDNVSACSGTVIGVVQGTTAVSTDTAGTVLSFDMPAANGITGCGGTGSAAVTISYF